MKNSTTPQVYAVDEGAPGLVDVVPAVVPVAPVEPVVPLAPEPDAEDDPLAGHVCVVPVNPVLSPPQNVISIPT